MSNEMTQTQPQSETGVMSTKFDPKWLERFNAALATGDDDVIGKLLAETPDVRIDVAGGNRYWVVTERGTLINGKVLGVEDREQLQNGQMVPKTDYAIQLIACPKPVYMRSSDDPTGDEKREIVTVNRGNKDVKVLIAQPGDVVYLGENHPTKILRQRIGCVAWIRFKTQRDIGNGQSVWDAQVLTKGTPRAALKSAEQKQIGAGNSDGIPF